MAILLLHTVVLELEKRELQYATASCTDNWYVVAGGEVITDCNSLLIHNDMMMTSIKYESFSTLIGKGKYGWFSVYEI